MSSRIIEAYLYEACKKCGALRHDPCRTPQFKTTAFHKGRRKTAPLEAVSCLETATVGKPDSMGDGNGNH